MSVQTDLEARTAQLAAILEDSNTALAKKGGAPAENLAEVPLCIRGLGAGVELEVLEIEPTTERIVVDADDGHAFHRVIVGAVGGSEFPVLALPDEYLAYVEYCRENLYDGDFSHLVVWETHEFVAVSFLMDDFEVLSFDPDTTELTAIGWHTCGYTKATGEWTYHDHTEEASTGENYAKNIKFASCYITYNGQTLFPVGDTPDGGSADLNISYGDVEPADTTSLWIKTQKPNRVTMTNDIPSAYDIDWNDSTNYSAASAQTAVTVRGKVYLFGGRASGDEVGSIYRFDPVTKEMEVVCSQYPTYGQAAAVVDKKVYLFGGYQYNQSVGEIQVFDTETNTIRTLTDKTVSNQNATAVAVGTKVYLFGGSIKEIGFSSSWDSIYVLDTETEIVTQLDQVLPGDMYGMFPIFYGENIYLLGGFVKDVGRSSQIIEFNLESLTVTVLETEIPASLSDSGWAVSAGKLFMFGGRADGKDSNKIYCFDPVTKTVSILDATLYQATSGLTATTVGNSIYIFGENTIQRFDVSVSLAHGSVLIETSATENIFKLIRSAGASVEIGVKKAYAGNAENVAEEVKMALYRDGAWAEI